MIYDTKSDFGGNRLWCDAWSGARSPAFRKFIRDFSTGASAAFLDVALSTAREANIVGVSFCHIRVCPK